MHNEVCSHQIFVHLLFCSKKEKEDEIDTEIFAFRISSDNDEYLSSLAESDASFNDESTQDDESVDQSMVNVEIKTVEVPKAPGMI